MSNRRDFLLGLGAAAMPLAAAKGESSMAVQDAGTRPSRILPKALEPGMTVALVSPSSHLFEPSKYDLAEGVVRSLGFIPRWMPHARDQRGYLAGADADRLADLHAAFADDSIHAVWCLRGGYGALRLLAGFDAAVVRAHPKVFLGYSDITALHLAIRRRAGLVTFHAPMPSSNLSDYAVAEFRRVVMTKAPAGRIGAPPRFEPVPGRVDRTHPVTTIRGGKAEGPLIGGNLTLLSRLTGTPFFPDLSGCILFVEDVGEAAYRIDGMLCQLRLSGALSRCAGIVFGKFTEEGDGDQPMRLPTEVVLRELTADLGIPVFSGLLCGHLADQTTVPCGVVASMDADAGTLTVLEAAVT